MNATKHNMNHLSHTEEIAHSVQEQNKNIQIKIKEQQKKKWADFANNLNHKYDCKKVFSVLRSITKSNSQTLTSHAAITLDNTIPSYKQQANILINHYANISHLPRRQEDRKIIKRKAHFPIDISHKPFTIRQTKHILKNLKNSAATGLDGISNYHLKHLGPRGIQALTDIANYSYSHCRISDTWKHGIIITILKPNKDPTLASSYRPITLLSTLFKVIERLILNIVTPYIPLSSTQHGFRPQHSTNTLLTQLTHNIVNGCNHKLPHKRTLLITLDISKAFDATPKHQLIDKIYNTNMHNNSKRWLVNYLSGRMAHVNFNDKSSKTRLFRDGVPQGSVLSPTLFNLFLHDIPTPTSEDIKISSYADDITITSTHAKHSTAATNLQPYLDTLQNWLTKNRLKVAPEKSTATLITLDLKEHSLTDKTPVTLYNTPIPYTNRVKILGVTYDTAFSFKHHIEDIKHKCEPKLKALKAISGQDFGQSKETSTTIFKQFLRPTMEYCSTAWSTNLADTHYKTLQIKQNDALRIATGCTKTTPIDHLHAETKILKIKDHIETKGAQYYDNIITDTTHPLHHTLHTTPSYRSIRSTPATRYTNILNTIPPPPGGISNKTHIHNTLATKSIRGLGPNTVLGAHPPEIDPSELSLSREDRVHLSRLRSGHHNSLLSYRKRLYPDTSDICPLCNSDTHTIHHIMQECHSLHLLRQSFNPPIHTRDLWVRPGKAIAFLRNTGLLTQGR